MSKRRWSKILLGKGFRYNPQFECILNAHHQRFLTELHTQKLTATIPIYILYVVQLESSDDEGWEYIRIASVRERVISKTSLDASKYADF